jgi:signal transduction histidine kinase
MLRIPVLSAGSVPALGLGGAVFLTALLHYLLQRNSVDGADTLSYIYFLPVVFGAIRFGRRGGIATGLLAGTCWLAAVAGAGPPGVLQNTTKVLPDVLVLFLAGFLAGTLTDRERKRTRTLQKTTSELAEVYEELHHNFELMKRNERLYAMGQLSAGLAHEIRNPLASIEGAAAIMKSEPGSEERRLEFLDIIQKECRRLNRLLTNFLEFARPQPPQYTPVDIDRLFESVIVLASHAIGRKPVTLRRVVESGMPALECDPEQMKQVLLNLTINAIQASHEGEIVLQAQLRDGKAQIQVRDPGSGMAPELAGRLFDLFFTTKENGTGLGLPVAHRIVSQHGGILSASNNEDKGMTFSVVLPLSREDL